jgi:hypothetical protein
VLRISYCLKQGKSKKVFGILLLDAMEALNLSATTYSGQYHNNSFVIANV